jgi:hypothetical protein
VPETFGKRQRRQVKERKAAAREERRLARHQRREDRAAGLLPEPDLESIPPVMEGQYDEDTVSEESGSAARTAGPGERP